MRWLRVKPADVIVIYDDVDLKYGSLRVRAKGSAGSHNGMKSVIGRIKTQGFPRIRIGIGPKPAGEDMIDFVLGPFADEETLMLEKIVQRAADAVETVFTLGVEKAMNQCNQS